MRISVLVYFPVGREQSSLHCMSKCDPTSPLGER